MVSTDYSETSLNSTNFGTGSSSTDVLLLEGGDKLLIEGTSDAILLESSGAGDTQSTNFTGISINSTNYS